MRNFFVSVRGIEQGGAPQCASKAPVGLCLARGRFPYGSYRTNGFPLWGKLSPQVTDEGVTPGHFPLIRRASAPPSPQGRRLLRRGGVTPPYGAIKIHRAVGAGHAPPAVKWWRKNHGLGCRGGIYAARATAQILRYNGKTARDAYMRPLQTSRKFAFSPIIPCRFAAIPIIRVGLLRLPDISLSFGAAGSRTKNTM